MPLNEDYEAEFEKALAEMAAQTEGFTEDMRDVIEKALPPPVVDADTAACRALRAIRYHKAQFERLERSYKDEIAELRVGLDVERTRFENRINWYMIGLRLYLDTKGEKSYKLPEGIIRYRKVSAKTGEIDVEKLKAWCEAEGYPADEFIETPEPVSKPKASVVKGHVTSTGEIPDGVEWIDETKKFEVDTKKPGAKKAPKGDDA